MTVRKISLKVLTQNELVKVETAARTFGEFKTEVANLGIDWSSVKLIDRATKATFEVDDTVLPATDAIMFVMPTKSKAGASYQAELRTKIKELKENGVIIPFNYSHATNAQMKAFLVSVETPEEDDEENIIYLKPGVYTLVVESVELGKEIELVDETTLDDLEEEAQALYSVIK